MAGEHDGADPETVLVPALEPPSEGPELPPPSQAQATRDPRSIDPWTELSDEDYPPDGPVAAPQDAPPENRLVRTEDRGRWSPSRRAPRAEHSGPTAPAPSVRVRRRVPSRVKAKIEPAPPEPAPPKKIRGRKGKGRSPDAPPRKYPLMRALLRAPERVPDGNVPVPEPPPPPVPGTFFPGPRVPLDRPAPEDLDALLTTMAEGLLIGETPDGQTEVRVTLRDEFFAGTELRIAVNKGQIHATLVPPERDVYWELNANVPGLRARLESKGLNVHTLEVIEPV